MFDEIMNDFLGIDSSCFTCSHKKVCSLSEQYASLNKEVDKIEYDKDTFKVRFACIHYNKEIKNAR